MKVDKEHRVPLSQAAIRLLEQLYQETPPQPDDFIFPAPHGGMLSDISLTTLIKRMHDKKLKEDSIGYIDPKQNRVITTHGFRSTFRDWSADKLITLVKSVNMIAELTSYRQHLLSKTTKNESTNEIESHPISTESIRNEMTLPASESEETGLIRSEKEISERNHDALIGTHLPNKNDKNQNQKRRTHSTAQLAKKTKPAKPIYLERTQKKQKAAPSINQPMTDQEDLNNEDLSQF